MWCQLRRFQIGCMRMMHWSSELISIAQTQHYQTALSAIASDCNFVRYSLLAVLTYTGPAGPTPLPMRLTTVLKLRLHASWLLRALLAQHQPRPMRTRS